jgi:mycothiol synthase
MAVLSNIRRPNDGEGSPAITCGPARPEQVEPALRLMLGNGSGYASREQVLDFLSFAAERNIDVNSIWVAQSDGQILWALLPLPSPGRTMLLFTPGSILPQTPDRAIGTLLESVNRHFSARGVMLAQMLIDPSDQAVIEAYCAHGCIRLAKLVYLQRSAPWRASAPQVPAGICVQNYSPQTHPLFVAAIRASYQASLDCPALNGVRDIEDVIAGHKASGDFDPNLWSVLTENEKPIGTLLLCRSHGDAMELIYLGLAPEARGRGIGDWLMQLALHRLNSQRRGRLTLAVDANNQPALALYYRHGMKQVATRVALLKVL